jgi:hypothetical protein
MRELSLALGISERRIARIIRDLANRGIIGIEKSGRRNSYRINEDAVCLPPNLSDASLGVIIRAAVRGPTETTESDGERKVLRSFLHGMFFPIVTSDTEIFEFLPSLLTALF